MSATHLRISVRWLDDRFHGQLEEGVPEWPPSPLRLFQSLVAAAGRSGTISQSSSSLIWLERLCDDTAPAIVSPPAVHGRPFLRYVPNNDSDKKPDRKNRLSEKVVVPTYIAGNKTIHYTWKLPEGEAKEWRTHQSPISKLAERIGAFGWGVDLAVGRADDLDERKWEQIVGEVWLPFRDETDSGLRVPTADTFQELVERHDNFCRQITTDGRDNPPALHRFRRVEYRRASDPAPRPVACFSLERPEGGFRAFDPPRNTVRVAGMFRHAAKRSAGDAGGWPLASFVLGHGENPGEKHQTVNNRRFAYLPLPSIQSRGSGRSPVVGDIRRVCVTVFDSGHEREIEWARQTLPGQILIREETGEIAASLSPAPQSDAVLRRYLDPASEWATVSPVVLPGYDDPAHYRRRLANPGVGAEEQRRLLNGLQHRIDKLLRKAIRDAVFSEELAMHAELDWRAIGFWTGTQNAANYTVPDHLVRFPRLHVRLKWHDAAGNPVRVPGPICLGGGRFYGLGLFAST